MQIQKNLASLDQLPPVLQELKALLEKHDFTYSYSDDHRAWQRGQQSLLDIQFVTTKADEIGLGLAATELWDQYCPKFMRILRYPEEA